MPYEHCYHPIIARNTPLPVSRTDSYFTVADNQEGWRVSIYQGDDPDALNNILVGEFLIEGLSRVPAGNEILCRMDLDLDGILRVAAIEKRTGLAQHITIEGATTALSEEEIAQARRRMAALYGEVDEEDLGRDAMTVEAEVIEEEESRDQRVQISEARALLERSRRLLDKMAAEDREEAIALHEQLEVAMNASDWRRLREASAELANLLFYVEEG
jgi:molecular chaperone DnaK (HSP70)